MQQNSIDATGSVKASSDSGETGDSIKTGPLNRIRGILTFKTAVYRDIATAQPWAEILVFILFSQAIVLLL
jgi:hypothetical protein